MSEVDDNLNYMLSQLSLVVSEFNQVKTGLGQAMEGMEEDLLEEFKRQQGEDSQAPPLRHPPLLWCQYCQQ